MLLEERLRKEIQTQEVVDHNWKKICARWQLASRCYVGPSVLSRSYQAHCEHETTPQMGSLKCPLYE